MHCIVGEGYRGRYCGCTANQMAAASLPLPQPRYVQHFPDQISVAVVTLQVGLLRVVQSLEERGPPSAAATQLPRGTPEAPRRSPVRGASPLVTAGVARRSPRPSPSPRERQQRLQWQLSGDAAAPQQQLAAAAVASPVRPQGLLSAGVWYLVWIEQGF